MRLIIKLLGGGVISNFFESTPNGRDLDRVLQSD